MFTNTIARSVHHAVDRVRTRLEKARRRTDDGFILLESMIAIALITVIMGAVGVEYVYSLSSASRLRATQVATELADSALDQVRALSPSDLVTGRDSASVNTEFTNGQAVASVAPWLASMDQISDPNAAAGAGATATVPTAPKTQQPGTQAYQITEYLGSCQLISTTSGSNCVPAAQVPATQTSTAIKYLRVVVTAGWTAPSCGSVGCMYVTSSLISNAPDPTFRSNQALATPPLIVQPANQKNEVGDVTALQLSLQPNTGTPAYIWSVASGSLPTGLSIDPAKGLISGTVAGPTGAQSVTVQVTDGYGRIATTTFTWTVYPGPTVTAPANQSLPINSPATIALTTTCPNGPCTYSMTNPPAGLSISNAGVISGTPTVAGPVTSVVTVTDAAGVSQSTSSFVLTVVANVATCPTAVALTNGGFETPTVNPGPGTNVYNGTSGIGWSTDNGNGTLEYWANGSNSQAQNGNTPITAEEGSQWVEMQSSAYDTLSQTLATAPGQVVQWSIWHRARNTTNNVAAQDSMQVRMGASGSTTAQVPASQTGATISDGASAWVNYRGFYTVPAGQTSTVFQAKAISSSGGLAGAGNFLDGVSVTGVPCMTTLPANQTSTVNQAITPVSLTASQGSGSFTWSGAVPNGLSLSANGRISGTPTTTGTTQVSLTLTDTASGYQESVPFTWTVVAAPSVSTANQTSTVNRPTSASVASTCPNNPCTFTVTGQPTGLSINASTGTISGTPTAMGSSTVTVTITDNAGATAASSFTWVVKTPPTIVTPANQATDVGTATNLSVSSTCPNTACTYAMSGAPAGLTIDSSSGAITGTPRATGVSTVTITITDQAGASASTPTFRWTVYNLPTVTSPGTQGTTVNAQTLLRTSSTCDNTPCTFALTGAPSGLSINSSTGTITGSPTATGASTSTRITITDNSGISASTTFTWTVYNVPTVTAPSNQSTVNNATVNLSLTTTCPNGPCSYALNGGPAGLTIGSGGVVSGRVTSAQQTFTGVTVTVTDSSGTTATTAVFTWTVTAPLAGRWTFDEASGSTAADSAGSHPVTLSGSYARTATDVQGANAVTMNGSAGTYATTSGPVLNTANSFTVSVWAKLTSTSDYSTFAAQSGTSVSGFYLQYNPNSNRFRFYKLASDSILSGGAAQSSVAAPVIGQWYQLTGVYDATAGTISLFVNGVRQGAPVAATGGFNATGNFTIGAGNFGGLTNWTSGAIDDVRAYSSALSDDAVTQLAQAAYWRFDEGSGTTARDSSLNGADGTLSGGTSWTPGIVGSSALQFNGSSGAVTSSPNPLDTSQSFSVSAWAKATSTNSTGVVVSADGSTISSFLLRQNNDKWAMLGVRADSGNTTVTTATATSSLVAGQWYYLVGVYDSVAKTIALYVNGVLQGSPVSVSGNFQAGGPLVIGRSYYQGATNYFNGTIDDVHAFRFPLDQAGVTALATLTPAAPATPTASAGTSSATVNWTTPTQVAGSPVTGYVVTPYLDGVAQTAVTYSSTATSQTVTGLSPGGSYTFTVQAVNANGTSAQSGLSTAVLPT